MDYVSTRGQAPSLTFDGAMLAGLARDGGLYVPAEIPAWRPGEIAALAGLPYEEVAFRVMRPFVGGAIPDDAFRGAIDAAYAGFVHPARAPLVQLAPDHFLLELFHGPTLAFKDFAMQLIGCLFDHELARRGRAVTIVGATSGDTGAAAIEAFRGSDRVSVFILFPEGRISQVQRRQMTTPGEANIHALALSGDFDACQARLKDMFNDFAFRDAVSLAAVNSINWVRVLAQTVYYFTAAVALGAPDRPIRFTVPTGNFGDIYAATIARRMGLPIESLVVATNQNDILHRVLTTGDYTAEPVRPSISPAMDIQVASNFERALYDAMGRDGAAVAQLMAALKATGGIAVPENARAALASVFASGRASEAETQATIARIHAETGMLICPHTAVGVKVAAEQPKSAAPMVTLATAHPAKFPDAVAAATGVRPVLPAHLADLMDRPERVTPVPNDLVVIETLIRDRTAA
jgi:threonine synthase